MLKGAFKKNILFGGGGGNASMQSMLFEMC